MNDNEHGITYIRNRRYSILVNGSDSLQVQRFTIGHEIGHIYLKHFMKDGLYGRSFGARISPQTKDEYEAERFAMDILAPACILWGLGVRSAVDIAKLCNIPMDDAQARADRMRELYKRDVFLASELEKRVFEQFENYISEHRK